MYQKSYLLLVLSFLVLTLSGCGTTPSSTTIISDAKVANQQTTLINEDIAPINVHGSQKLVLEGQYIYLNDDGLQQIAVPNTTNFLDMDKEILSYLDSLTLPSPSDEGAIGRGVGGEGLETNIKQATINIQGSSFTILGGSGLQEYIHLLHTTTTVSGNDLIVTAHPDRIGAISYLVVSNKNPINYMIQNPTDRYNPSLFMIAKDNYTIVKLQWNSDIDQGNLRYQSGVDQYGLDLGREQLAIPDGTKLGYKPFYKNPTTELRVFHVSHGGPVSSYVSCDTLSQKPIPVGTIEAMKQAYSNGSLNTGFLLRNFLDSCDELIANSSGEYILNTKQMIGNSSHSLFQQGIIILTPAHYKIITRSDPKFDPNVVDSDDKQNPYLKMIITPYELDQNALQESLSKILSTGEFSLYGNGFSYRIQPKKKYSGNIELRTVFGQSKSVPLSLYIDAIDKQFITQQVLANNSISLLPNDGSFQDVLIQHENIDTLPVTFSPCEVTNNVDWSKKSGQGLENHLFNCSDEKFVNTITVKDFKARKVYRTAVPLPESWSSSSSLQNIQAFKVSVPNLKGDIEPYYFYKSDIGIWTKIAGDELHVRGFLFGDNSPITSGTITVKTLGESPEMVETKTIQGTQTIIKLPKDTNGNLKSDILLVTLSISDDKSSFVVVDPNRSSQYSRSYRDPSHKSQIYESYTINSYLNPQDVTASNTNLNFRGEEYPVKLYGYSDRGLYKAGDTVYFAGFVRDLSKLGESESSSSRLQYLTGKTIAVDITDPQGNSLYANSGLELDGFGGFKGSAPLPKTLPLGDAILNYHVNGSDEVSYAHNIKIEEYQKPTFFIDTSHSENNGQLNLLMSPKYFFGQPLKDYDINVNRSLAGKDICYYCYWWNQDNYYYNYVFSDTISTGGQFSLYNQTAETLQKSLFPKDILQQKGYQYSLKADIIVKDNNSDETQFFTRYIDFNPTVKLGLSGQPNDWVYNENGKDMRKDFKIDGEIKEGKDLIQSLNYDILYWSYDQTTQQGIDGSSYYINGNNYQSISSGSLAKDTNFKVATSFITKPGSYLLRVFAKDPKGNIIGEVQKQIEYYEFSNDPDGLLGALPNNYTLTVNIPKKTYEENEMIPVDIAPYQKGARVIMTVERGNQIIDTIETTLDGAPLSIKVKKGYAPNIVVNVMQLIGSDKASGPRKEPRFLVGYGQAEISTAMHEMRIEIGTDKEVYKPNETVKLSITTKDTQGNPIDTRLSLGVIDKALMAMYDATKEPIPYFFNKLGTSIANYTNMKLLYQSLKVFANNGSKGGGGMGGKAMFSMIRDDLEDVAFWRGAVYTTGGKAEISFTLPENLTTRVVDIIGISKDTRLGTSQQEFKVSKNLVIEANPPTFVTLGDELQIPIKLIVAPEAIKNNQEIKGNARLENGKGEKIELGNFTAKANSKILLTTKIPDTWIDITMIQFVVEGNYGNDYDGIVQNIPLRTEGLTMRDSIGVINSAGSHTFTIPESRAATISLSLSQFPTNLIDPLIQYLVSYPYACTEQLLSTLLPLKIAQDLAKTGKFTSTLLSGDYVETYNGILKVSSVFADGISQILSRQNSNGSFALWKRDDTVKPNIYEYMISAYVYSSLITLKEVAPSQPALSQALKQVESYLRTYRTLSKEGFLYYLSQKSLAGEKLTLNESDELATINPKSLPYGGVLRYIIAVGQENMEDIQTRRDLATIPTNQDWMQTSMFLNQETAYALKLMALAKDPGAIQEKKMEALQTLIATRQKSGLRSSTQSSVQSLKAIVQIAKDRPKKELVNCSVDINGEKYTKQITMSGTELISKVFSPDKGSTPTKLEGGVGGTTTVQRTCDSPLIADTIISYIPKNLVDQLGADTHVTQMNYALSNPKANIGETLDLNASRTTTLPGEQVAVEIFIPSTLKLLSTIKGQSDVPHPLPFTLSDQSCQPSHRETKFDRLFLYYDNLQAITCDITIPALKAYNGTPIIQPMRVYEMYKGKVNGRKVIQ